MGCPPRPTGCVQEKALPEEMQAALSLSPTEEFLSLLNTDVYFQTHTHTHIPTLLFLDGVRGPVIAQGTSPVQSHSWATVTCFPSIS